MSTKQLFNYRKNYRRKNEKKEMLLASNYPKNFIEKEFQKMEREFIKRVNAKYNNFHNENADKNNTMLSCNPCIPKLSKKIQGIGRKFSNKTVF